MTPESSSPDPSSTPSTEPSARPRRAASPRPKKNAKIPAPSEAMEVPAAIALPDSEPAADLKNEWPEPEDASTGGPGLTQTESAKRKRRRRKGKGAANHSNAPTSEASADEASTPVPAAPAQPVSAPRPKVDPALLTKMAWKIFLAEVSEEGVALISDNDAKDLSRRCFRLAEIFVEEQSRRR
jgi:hypothetical protein